MCQLLPESILSLSPCITNSGCAVTCDPIWEMFVWSDQNTSDGNMAVKQAVNFDTWAGYFLLQMQIKLRSNCGDLAKGML